MMWMFTHATAFSLMDSLSYHRQIIKGADKVSSLKHVYSPPSDFMCGVELMEDTEYLLTGRLNGDKVHIGLCDLVRPWAELIPAQQQNVLKYYQLGCSCRIMTCFSLPCSVFADDECLWTDLVQNEHKDGYQARNFACLPQPHLPTLCSWHHGMAPALDEAEDDYDYEEERPEPLLARARPDFYPPGTKYNRLVI
uniref:NTR domain-containing protein n=1 Tax=Eptatretus burgeri TaxID=7764 RepID=A0A8C4WXK7_EPTBU